MRHLEEGEHMMDQSDVGRTAGVAAAAAGGGLAGRLLRNPLLLLAAGFAAGYLVHRHRKEIVAAVMKATGAGKDFLLQQQESLEDLIAEAKEAEGEAAGSGKEAAGSGG